MILKKKLTCAILLATLGQSAHSFEFFLDRTFGDYADKELTAQTFPGTFEFKTNLVDIDNDGDIDIWMNTSLIWFNNGKGRFSKKNILSKNKEDNVARVILVDIDNDGDIDQIVSSNVYLNDGQGNLTPDSGHILSFINNDIDLYPLYFIDLNNDQKLDLISTSSKWILNPEYDGSNPFNQYLLKRNPLLISLNDDTVPFLVNENAPSYFDKMTDEEIQAFIPNKYRALEQDTSYFDTTFNSHTIIREGINELIFADVDNDGDVDFWISQKAGNLHFSLLLNDGTGQFTESTQADFFASFDFDGAKSSAIATGDIDNDGDLDAWISRTSDDETGAPAVILINDGSGQFTQLPQDFGMDLNSTGITMIDIDNDGDLDGLEVSLIEGSSVNQPTAITNKLKIWLNDGTGKFTNSHIDIAGFYGAKVEVADLNNDGLIDIVVGNQVWMNGVEKVNIAFFDWLEAKFPTFFPKAVKVLNFIFGDWEYRYYPSVKTYVGINKKEQAVYVLGDAFGGLKRMGSQQEWIEQMRLDLSK